MWSPITDGDPGLHHRDVLLTVVGARRGGRAGHDGVRCGAGTMGDSPGSLGACCSGTGRGREARAGVRRLDGRDPAAGRALGTGALDGRGHPGAWAGWEPGGERKAENESRDRVSLGLVDSRWSWHLSRSRL
jgi:hypothetical protein